MTIYDNNIPRPPAPFSAWTNFGNADSAGGTKAPDNRLSYDEATAAGFLFDDLNGDGFLGWEEVNRIAYAESKSGGTVDNLINEDEADMVGCLFYDPNNDGLMDASELNEVYSENKTSYADERMFFALTRVPFIDPNDDGLLDVSEFETVYGTEVSFVDARMSYAEYMSDGTVDNLINEDEAKLVGLSFYDSNNDGFMDVSEMTTLYKPADATYSNADLNKDGKLDRDEWRKAGLDKSVGAFVNANSDNVNGISVTEFLVADKQGK